MSILNVAAYKFVELGELVTRRASLRRRCHELDLRGTILLAEEGINLFVAGQHDNVSTLMDHLQSDPAIGPLEIKESESDYQPFTRMLVKIKQEIIAFGVDGVAPAQYTSKRIAPQELKQWLDEGRPVTLLDTRNDYEVDLGTFETAEHLNIGHFRDFPQAAQSLPDELRDQPVVTFCTGGIRCEKAAPMLEQIGFRDVYQLDGGILKYFEVAGGAHYRGDCFVFDQRVAVDAALRETDAAQCYACQAILTTEDQQSPHYVKGEHCPRCYRTSEEAMQHSIERRHAVIRKVATPLPGSEPYDRRLPLHVAGEWDGMPMVEFLHRAVPSMPPEYWQEELACGRILFAGHPVDSRRTTVAGEKFEHLLPGVVEPDVNIDIRILYEDADLVVVDKPAPLPIHPGGRFERNTLSHLMAEAYAPERLRHAHRLDANTTGLVVFARTRRVAKLVQPQFERGDVEKQYLARVIGHPAADRFDCTSAIARDPSAAGVRLPDEAGAEAHTEFEVLQRMDDGTSLLIVRPFTGRTNQIRAHLWELGLPIVGDPAYLPAGETAARQTLAPDEPAMCLHAWRLSLVHPSTRERVTFEAPHPVWANAGAEA
ncbi:sulfurtransferase [Aeoliella sp. ICT_H6.2]|uniref:tRNA uridine(34) hydroxylase n=1 Tax=Aeoliella straminimaris TaxID=2954799 RepID=A0A9X2F746_9BACT|nr:sulfurtransferase [Aeoliella straminimaris]MCO6042817.1 sulfurtransferase [Aeoliella straminimaris]